MSISRTPLLNFSVTLSSCLSRLLLTLFIASVAGNAAQLTVAAAADLTSAESDLAAGFRKASGATVRYSTGASGILARQIANGAPFDVFLSANEKYVKDLAASGRIVPATVTTYASGRLGLWSKDGKIHDLKQLLDSDVRRIAIANPQFAPYGMAAKELLERRGYWRTLQPKIVYGENVTQTLQYGESGNADAVITSWTLLYARGGTLLPADHAPILQAAGVVAGSTQAALARRFVTYLTSAAGRAVLQAHGLTPP